MATSTEDLWVVVVVDDSYLQRPCRIYLNQVYLTREEAQDEAMELSDMKTRDERVLYQVSTLSEYLTALER